MSKISTEVINLRFKEYEKIFKALADERRLNILYLLADTRADSICVCDLMEAMEMAQSKLSYHLKILLDANLITQEKKGTWHYYSLHDENINAVLSEEFYCALRESSNNRKTLSSKCC